MHVPARARLGPVEIAVGVDPEDTARAPRASETAERPERDGVIAAQYERQEPLLAGAHDEIRDPFAARLDLVQKADALAADRDRFGHRRLDVSPVHRAPADPGEPSLQARVADRRRPHVDAAAASAEIERRADHGDRLLRPLRAHRRKARDPHVDVAARVEAALARGTAVRSVRLVGSRLRGDATPLSDWDFAVEATDFASLAAQLPDLVRPLSPLAQQWDPLSENDRCYMLMLQGPHKVDLIFDLPHDPEPPWIVAPETIAAVDAHFWDWILWIAAKTLAGGKESLVRAELEKMSRHVLAPMGASAPALSVEAAVASYRAALAKQERRLGVHVSCELGDEVGGGLRRAGFRL